MNRLVREGLADAKRDLEALDDHLCEQSAILESMRLELMTDRLNLNARRLLKRGPRVGWRTKTLSRKLELAEFLWGRLLGKIEGHIERGNLFEQLIENPPKDFHQIYKEAKDGSTD